jgi:peptidoglycan-associated lipoprotein
MSHVVPKEKKKMKMKPFGLVLLTVALGLSLSACGCFQQAMKGETAPPPAAEPAAIAAPEAKAEVAGEAPAAAPAPAVQPTVAVVELNDVHFDFDKYNIRPGDAETLNKDYGWFTANTGRVKIEGNCDERGTVEYNLVLGQKRADSTKYYMIKLGVDGKRIDTISYGKERPVDPGHSEEAWAKNRRVHFAPID